MSKFGPATLRNPNPQLKIQILLNQTIYEIITCTLGQRKGDVEKVLSVRAGHILTKRFQSKTWAPTAAQVNLSNNKLMAVDPAAKNKMVINFLPTINFKISICVYMGLFGGYWWICFAGVYFSQSYFHCMRSADMD